MPRPLQFLLFFITITLVTGAIHYYAWVRLVRDTGLAGAQRQAATLLIWGLFGLLLLGMPLGRMLPRTVATPLLWVVYLWMGTLLFLLMTLAAADLVRLIIRLWPGAPIDPERRQLFHRVLAQGVVAGSAALSALATREGTADPRVRDITITLPRLPAALSGLRIVQLTDVHIGPTLDGAWLRRVVERVNALSADVIVITGDLVDGSVDRLREHTAELAALRARHGVFFVTGNHEYYSGPDAWIAELSRMGIRTLRNEHVTLQHTKERDGALDLAGVDDLHADSFPGHGPDLRRALSGRDARRPVVLLAHQPAAAIEAATLGVDLQLSGHTHGGQIWPWGYMVRLQQPYIAGLYRRGDTQIYVSCGTGYWGPPMRLVAQAEITHITLRAPG